jgi:hypothetical protein
MRLPEPLPVIVAPNLRLSYKDSANIKNYKNNIINLKLVLILTAGAQTKAMNCYQDSGNCVCNYNLIKRSAILVLPIECICCGNSKKNQITAFNKW